MTGAAAPVITIDGPAASGKGTIAANAAAALAFHYLDSGALYRLVAVAAQRGAITADDGPALAREATRLDVRFAGGRVTLDGRDVTDEIRGEAAGRLASAVAVHPGVRAALLDRQRAFRTPPGLLPTGATWGRWCSRTQS